MALDSFRNEQIKLLYAGLPTALAINAAAAAIVAIRFATTAPVGLLMAWLAAMAAVLLLRGMVWWRWRQAGAAALDAGTPWLPWFRLTTMFTGLGWACSVWLLLPPGGYAAHGFEVGFLCIVLLGLSAGAVASLSVDAVSALGYRLPMIIAIGVELASDNSETGRTLGVLALLYLLYVTANSARMSRSVHENIRLRLEADAREALLHQSEDRLNEAQHMAGLGSFDWNPVSGELQWSVEHFRLWGLSPGVQQADYALFRQGLHSDDVARVEAALQQALSGGANYDCEHRVCRPDGSVLHIHGRGQVSFDTQGRAVRMVGTVLDITAQKRAAEALAASRDNLQCTLEATGDGIFAYDGRDNSGRLLFANAELFRMWRIPESEIPHTGRAEIIAAARKLFIDPDREVALIQHILTLDTRYEDRVRLNDGRVFSRRSIPILGHAGVSRIWSFRDVTTEERVLELAQANEAQQSALLGAFPGSIGRLDADLRYTYVNERLAQRLGASARQIMGRAIGEFLGAQREAELRALIMKAQAGERVVFEEQYSGVIDVVDQFTLAVGKDPLSGAEVVYFFGIDISELKRTEQALRISQERFRDFADSSSDWYWESDAEHRFTYFSENAERLLGRDRSDVLGRRRTELIEENNLNPAFIVEQHAAQLQAREAFREFEYRMKRADGGDLWVSVSGLPHFDADQGFVGYRGTARDITAKKRIEHQLADRKAHLEDLVEQRTAELSRALAAARQAEESLRIAAVAFESHEGMFVTDVRNVILRVNSAFTEITGFSAEEAIGQTPRLFKSGRHDAEFYRAMWQMINSTGRWQGEIWDKRKDGTIYPKWLTISAVKNEEGVVTHYVGSHFDITERKLAEERIHELAFFDQLTGLPNRTLLLDRLRQSMTASTRSQRYGALLFLDLDHFKTLNDSHGHDKGDLLLREVAQRLTDVVRTGDTVARLGGDEFVVLLTSLSASQDDAAKQTETIGKKILASIAQPFVFDDLSHHCTASIGITLFQGQQTALDDLLKQADLAMYKSKSTGRDTLRFFDPKMEHAVLEKAAWEADLREAVRVGQFVLHYQAQVFDDGRVSGAEALVRWQHPERGMVSPARFIPLAEETGLILPLGQWVLESACRQLALWQQQPAMADLSLAVNVSPRQFREVDFVSQVELALARSGANPQGLKLELTESLMVTDVDAVIEKMFSLRARGVHFALDDFGIGYSSLSYLKRMPLDQLKIDQSFVRDILTDPNDAAIARTIVALGQSLGLAVIAEGVETEAQRDFLANTGCHAFQGYLFSRPVPVSEFEQLFAATEKARRDG